MNRTIFMNKAHDEQVVRRFFGYFKINKVETKSNHTFVQFKERSEAITVLKRKTYVINNVITEVSMAPNKLDVRGLSREQLEIVTKQDDPVVPQSNPQTPANYYEVMKQK